MLLSRQGYWPTEVAEILEGHADTVRRWIDHFNEQGCDGLVDHFASHIRRRTTLVIDNARVHSSAKFNAQLERWKGGKNADSQVFDYLHTARS